MNLDDLFQAMLLALTGSSALLISDPKHQGLAFALGLAAQPFWLYSTFAAGQWGMFAISLIFTFSYARGCWRELQRGVDALIEEGW